MNRPSMTITRKLWLLTGLLIANILAVGVIGMWNSKRLTHSLNVVGAIDLPALRHMTTIDMHHDGIKAIVYQAIVETERDPSMITEFERDLEEASAEIVKNLSAEAKLQISESAQKNLEGVKPTLDAYMGEARGILAKIKAGDRASLGESMKSFMVAFKGLEAELEKVADDIESGAEKDLQEAESLAATSDVLGAVLIAFGLFFGFGAGAVVIRSLVKSMKLVTDGLTADAQSLTVAADRINVASEALGNSTTEQAAAIEETASSMEEISSMIAQTSQSAQTGRHDADDARQKAEGGKVVVSRMVLAMGEISRSNDRLQAITKVISDIQSRTKVINDIAFETRLLAFNASIEAARAGVHGRGFAVVAEEVGKLAATSNKAADEVRSLLEDSLAQVTQIVSETKDKVEAGQGTSKECERAFSEMERALATIADSIAAIATASKEQASGVSQTNQAMNEMDIATQSNARNAEKLAGEANLLAQMARSLNVNADNLAQLVTGRSAGPGASGHAAPIVEQTAGPLRSSLSTSRTARATQPASPSKAAEPVKAASDDLTDKVDRDDSRWRAA